MASVSVGAEGRKLVRAGLAPEQSRDLVRQLGLELARLHTVRPPDSRLDFLPLSAATPALARVQAYRDALDLIPEPHPVLEWSLNWLQDHRSEEHTSELQSLMRISYADICLKQTKNKH